MKYQPKNLFRILLVIVVISASVGCSSMKKDVLDAQRIIHETSQQPGVIRIDLVHQMDYVDVKKNLHSKKGKTTVLFQPSQERLNHRTENKPATGQLVKVVLPNGYALSGITDQTGHLEIQMPDDPSLYFPMPYIAKIEFFPPFETDKQFFEVPVTMDAIKLLPVSVHEKAKQFFLAVIEAKEAYQEIDAERKDALMVPGQKVLEANSRYPVLQIRGKVKDYDDNTLLLWGYALPLDGTSLSELGYSPGVAVQESNLIVKDYNRQNLVQGSYLFYQGKHCYLSKTSGTNAFGAFVPAKVYGVPPNYKEIQKVVTQFEAVKEQYRVPMENAKQAYLDSIETYRQNLPTNPYGLNLDPFPEKKPKKQRKKPVW